MKKAYFFYYLILTVAFGILIVRLFDLTIIRGAENRELSDGQRIRVKKIKASRGIIFDKEGRPLVRNIPLYKKCQEPDRCRLLTHEEALRLESASQDSDLIIEIGREYLYPEATAHVLGYLSEAAPDEVESGKYTLGQMVGRGGIEEQYNADLSGTDGEELVEVDSLGQTIRKIGQKEGTAGKNLYLNLDLDLQRRAYESLKTVKGAVIAQDSQGRILAFVSSPSFNPNKLEENVLVSPDYPLFNRIISGAYPPGSTFKIITATAGLEEEKINNETLITDSGQIVIGNYRYSNWFFSKYGKTEGEINVVRALARSTDTFFYKLGEMVGARSLIRWAQNFDLGKLSGIDLPGEITGFLPDSDKLSNWFLGNTYHLSIGQGYIGLTPLQVNQMTGVVATGGKICRPQVVKDNVRQPNCRQVTISTKTVETITQGMIGACSSGGTAFPFFNFNPNVACKTGTAEYENPEGKTHAWLTAFAPSDKPEIVVTVLVEGGGEGSSVAAPIAKDIMLEYFQDK